MNKKTEVGMKSLVGKCFSLAEGRYRIVDIRQVGADAMVYAEPLGATSEEPVSAAPSMRGPRRTAFHYGDIAPLLGVETTA